MSFVGSALVYIDGMSRCAKERYQVHLLDERSGIARAVANPRATFYADPFVFTHTGETWLFCEAFECATNRGHIAAARVTDTLEIGPLARVLDPGCHASFPFVFESEGSAYLLPETSRAKCVDLYVCEAMPGRWRVAERLLDGVDCADSVLCRRDGLWYLVTSETDERTSPNRWLSIYCSDTLLSRRWTPHPVNRERRYVDRAHGYGRNAGAIVEAGTDLLRPMQASTEYYGQSASVMRIYALSPERYAEGPYEGGGHVVARIASEHSTHHVSTAGGLVAWDTRTHVGYFRRVRT